MKSLFFICFLLVQDAPTGTYGAAVSLIREYFYIPQLMNWTTAQNYCREHYWDLATITTEEENNRVVNLNEQRNFIWIGLNRTIPHVDAWQWSDGEVFDFTNWFPGEPNDFLGHENCVEIIPNEWNDADCELNNPFICYRRFILVNEKKTWEEALQHCRTHYSYLVIVDSQTLLDLLKTETEEAQTASVWTGLHFLDGNWLWVNGAPLGSLVSLPQCPIQPYSCGAFNINTHIWENRHCNEELHFLCY
ncbi:macrophage mannose receptor 1-like [Tachysurus ichikawai]